jgi:hypothetical protein
MGTDYGRLGADYGTLGVDYGTLGGTLGGEIEQKRWQENPSYVSEQTALRAKHGEKGGQIEKERAQAAEVICTKCVRSLPPSAFNQVQLAAWRKTHNTTRDAICAQCAPEKRGRLSSINRATDPEKLICCRECKVAQRPAMFETADITLLLAQQELWKAICLACIAKQSSTQPQKRLREKTASAEDAPLVRCARCERDLRVEQYSLVSRKRPRDTKTWRCLDCQYPECAVCRQRSTLPYNQIYKDGEYFCASCAWPPCQDGCGTPRPRSSKYHIRLMPSWRCPKCRPV